MAFAPVVDEVGLSEYSEGTVLVSGRVEFPTWHSSSIRTRSYKWRVRKVSQPKASAFRCSKEGKTTHCALGNFGTFGFVVPRSHISYLASRLGSGKCLRCGAVEYISTCKSIHQSASQFNPPCLTLPTYQSAFRWTGVAYKET